jgi:hypothetical protein
MRERRIPLPPSPAKAARNPFTLTFADGLWDVFFGCVMLAQGVRPFVGSGWSTVLLFAGLLAFVVGKRLVTNPRLGSEPPQRARRHDPRVGWIIAGGAALAAVAILVFALVGGEPTEAWSPWAFVAGITVAMALLAYALDFPRMYGYALLVGLSVGVSEGVGQTAGAMVFVLSGGLILLGGLVYLIRFLLSHPLPDR